MKTVCKGGRKGDEWKEAPPAAHTLANSGVHNPVGSEMCPGRGRGKEVKHF